MTRRYTGAEARELAAKATQSLSALEYAVIRPAGGIVAAGGGGVAARAAALALADVEPVERVKRALAIAAQVCPGVGEPMHVRDVRRR